MFRSSFKVLVRIMAGVIIVLITVTLVQAGDRTQLIQEKINYESELERVKIRMIGYILQNTRASAALLAAGGGLAAQLNDMLDQDTKNALAVFSAFGLWYCLENVSECATVASNIGSYVAQINGYNAQIASLDSQIKKLDALEQQRKKVNVASDKMDFCSRPIIPGDWQVLNDQDAINVVVNLLALKGDKIKSQIASPIRVRSLDVPFYANAKLYETEALVNGKEKGLITFIDYGQGILLLTGKSQPIHDTNKSVALMLNNEQQAEMYLRLFHSAIQGEDGTFKIIESTDELEWTRQATQDNLNQVRSKIIPLFIKRGNNGTWEAIGTVRYSNAIFQATMTLDSSGMVNMTDDQPLVADLPVTLEKYVDSVRVSGL